MCYYYDVIVIDCLQYYVSCYICWYCSILGVRGDSFRVKKHFLDCIMVVYNELCILLVQHFMFIPLHFGNTQQGYVDL